VPVVVPLVELPVPVAVPLPVVPLPLVPEPVPEPVPEVAAPVVVPEVVVPALVPPLFVEQARHAAKGRLARIRFSGMRESSGIEAIGRK
jgi:hypothetical protein